MAATDKTLAEHLRITEAEICARKALLGLTPAGESALGAFRPTIEALADPIVAEFYRHQLTVAEIGAIISDADTLARLKASMRSYVLRLFDGQYGMDYANARLRIGKVHARIGVSPKLYVASIHQLDSLLRRTATRHGATPEMLDSLHKLILFDLQLVFDTYIQGLVSEVETARDEVQAYSETLEARVAERTEEIARVARTDPLTGLGNRRAFFAALAEASAEAFATRQPLALGFFDADGFKAINDQFGHLHGDTVLARIGAAMKAAFQPAGRAFRYGGDEFCVLLPGADPATAESLCTTFCAELRGEVSISFGVASLEPGDRDAPDRLLDRADAAMYSGRRLPQALPRGA